MRATIWTDVAQLDYRFRPQSLDEAEESCPFDLSDGEEDHSDSCWSNGRELVQHSDNIWYAPGDLVRKASRGEKRSSRLEGGVVFNLLRALW